MKKYQYQDISLGGVVTEESAKVRSEVLTHLGKQGWKLISTYVVKHSTMSNSIELRAILEKELDELMLG